MILAWIMGALLLVQSTPPPESLVITKDEHPISIVTREEFSVSPTGIPIINSNKFSQLIKNSINKYPLHLQTQVWTSLEISFPKRLDIV